MTITTNHLEAGFLLIGFAMIGFMVGLAI